MTSVEVDSKRPRLGSYEHTAETTRGHPPPPAPASLPAPPPSSNSSYHYPPSHLGAHHHQHPPPYPHSQPPPSTPSHHPHHPHQPPPHHADHRYGPAPQHSHPPPHPALPPTHPPQDSTRPPPPSHSSSYQGQNSYPPPPPSATPDTRGRPYSSHASTLPMPAQHGAESSEPSQYHHHGHPYHARQYSTEPHSARTPTTPAQSGHPPPPPSDYNVKHAPQYYSDPYRTPGGGEVAHSPYHEQQTHPPLTMPPPQQPERSLPYPSMPHQASDPSGEYWPYGPLMTVQGDNQPRRKAVRASQACESCRQKKCKCDEEKPICGNCKSQSIQCVYRDVPPPKQERTMMQVMDQINALSAQMGDVGSRLHHLGGAYVRKDELRGELDSSIKAILHRELRDFRDEIRGAQMHAKRNSDYSQSPASRSHFASPNPVNGYEQAPGLSRSDSRRHFDAQQQAREGAAAYSPAGSQVSDGARGTPQQQQQQYGSSSRKIAVALDPAIKHFDPLAGQLSIPLEHSTAAHKLLISWHAIHPFYEGIIDLDYAQNYVMRGETQRGNLRIFGQGEGSDGISKSYPPAFLKQPSTSDQDDMSNSAYNNATSTSTAANSPGDGNWGIGFDGPSMPAIDTDGGLNPDGTLCLDATTVERLYRSFLQHMWILHPFLHKVHLHRVFERFLRRYGYDGSAQPATGVTSPPVSAEQPDTPGQFKAPKRKRSDGGFEEKFGTQSSTWRAPGADAARRPLERSMNNALILLILALGRICEHQGVLPPPVPEGEGSQPLGAAKSPSYGNTPRSAATPHFPSDSATPDATGRSPWSDSSSGRYTGRPRNIDRIPGLAYFAYAVGILGEHQGSPDLIHVQCNILAGLYHAQMARVIDSWRFINSACIDCQLLFKDENSFAYMDPDRADAIRFAYWTCLQLESDILAELDLPHSGISRLEDRMELPHWSTLHFQPESPEYIVMHYYWAQIHIRKILNRAHSALYNSGKEPLKNPGWTIYSADDLALQLHDWRSTLPVSLRWDETDEPATNVNDARLRGKYYGARYIIHRPFLHHLLEDEYEPNAPEKRQLRTKEKEGMIGMARKCIEAAKMSTVSFDGLKGRPRLTNVFGTSHAQFGNILVLAACKASRRFGWFINILDLELLIDRTIEFINPLALLAPTMSTNLQILRNTKKKLREYDEDVDMHNAASASFSSSTH